MQKYPITCCLSNALLLQCHAAGATPNIYTTMKTYRPTYLLILAAAAASVAFAAAQGDTTENVKPTADISHTTLVVQKCLLNGANCGTTKCPCTNPACKFSQVCCKCPQGPRGPSGPEGRWS